MQTATNNDYNDFGGDDNDGIDLWPVRVLILRTMLSFEAYNRKTHSTWHL